MEVVTLDIASVVDDKLAKDDAAHFPANKEFLANLAASIETDGQINPITVRPHPDQPGKYLPITGRKRLKALKKLGRNGVLAVVAEGLSDDQVRSQIIGDNIWRCPLNKARHMIAVREWWELHMRLKGESLPGADPAEEADVEPNQAEGEQAADPATAEPKKPAKPKKKEATKAERAEFTKKVASATGATPRTAQRATMIARALTAEQLSALDAVEAPQDALEKLAKVKDEDARAAAVALVLAGVGVDEAIGTRTGEAEKTDDPTDLQVWVEGYCGDIWKKLSEAGNTTAFLAAAELYRATKAARAAFAKATAKPLADAAGRSGMFGMLIRNLGSVAHPKDWKVCGRCSGTGFTPDATLQQASCPACKSDGFKMSYEGR